MFILSTLTFAAGDIDVPGIFPAPFVGWLRHAAGTAHQPRRAALSYLRVAARVHVQDLRRHCKGKEEGAVVRIYVLIRTRNGNNAPWVCYCGHEETSRSRPCGVSGLRVTEWVFIRLL